MREIGIRAWNKIEEVMYTDAINNCKDSFDMVLKHPQIYEVMQYTGLKDKDGVRIYEGDIVLIDIFNIQNSNRCSEEKKKIEFKRDLQIISFQNGSFGFYPVFPNLNHKDDRKWRSLICEDNDGLWVDEMQVLGNICENPELMEATK